MNNNLKILRFFVENKDEGFSIKNVAERLKMNYRIAYEEITELGSEGLIKIVKQGNSRICSFNYVFDGKVVEIERIRKKGLSSDVQLISDRIREIKKPFYSLMLFGSHASNKNTKGSDIDLCLITDDKKINKEVNELLSITPIEVHLQEFTSEQFRQMIRLKESNVGNEIVKNNIILHGMEAFYELVNDAKQ